MADSDPISATHKFIIKMEYFDFATLFIPIRSRDTKILDKVPVFVNCLFIEAFLSDFHRKIN